MTIGTVGGDANYQFGRIAGVAELSDGRIVVLDGQAQHLRVFSATGRFLNAVGRPGAGPGEIGGGAGPLLTGRGDTLLLPDPSNQRVTRFDSEVQPAGSSFFDMSQGFPAAWGALPDGGIVSHVRPIAIPGRPASDTLDIVVVRGSDGVVLDTLARLRPGNTFRMREGVLQYRFFSPEPVWGITSSGEFVYGHNDRYRLHVVSGGRLVRIVERAVNVEAVTEDDRRLIRDAISRTFESQLAGSELVAFRDAIGVADSFPVFHAIQGGPGGSIWVQRFQLPGDLPAERTERFSDRQLLSRTLGLGSPVWDVFDSRGRLLGSVEMPGGYEPLVFVGDRLYGVRLDELDVEHLVVLNVLRPSGH